ncbi:hypothetical protein L3Q82_009146 [Scortum barcoo]|uniref:Uncharacterized protein n=1 Tax=Scortum barcoo TaxID=214431 RepID=A0ACB8XAW0_9TELE|nr:hypothetical protein L3Q82_009146 [Scortum barcoo]
MQLVITRLGGNASPQPATPEPEQPSTPPVQPQSMPRPACLALPERYSGESGECCSFLVQCDLHFKNDPTAFYSDQAQVAFIISHLTGRAAALATAEWARGAAVCQDVKLFSQILTRMFDHSSLAREASRVLLGLRQGSRRVIDYGIQLRLTACGAFQPSRTLLLMGSTKGLRASWLPMIRLSSSRTWWTWRSASTTVSRRGRRSAAGPTGGPPNHRGRRGPSGNFVALQDLQLLPQLWIERHLQAEPWTSAEMTSATILTSQEFHLAITISEVLSKSKATSLPPHCPWDCAIDFLPGAPIPKDRLYAISGPERRAMDDDTSRRR